MGSGDLLSQRLGDVGVGGGGEVEEGGRDRRRVLVFEEGDDAVALGEDGFDALEVVLVVEGDGEFLEHALQAAAAGGEVKAVAFGFVRGFVAVVLLDVGKIQAGGEGGDGVVEEGALAEHVELGFLEAGVVDPEFLAVADGDAGARAFDFTAEFVGGLEGDRAFADERLREEVGVFFLNEIGGEGRVLLPMLLKGFHQGLRFREGKLRGAGGQDRGQTQGEGEAVSQGVDERLAHGVGEGDSCREKVKGGGLGAKNGVGARGKERG